MLTILDQEPEHCLKMPPIPFVSMMQLIRMWLMKVISNANNGMDQNSQHYLESRLIEVMISTIVPMQFVSSMNVIQLRLMRVIDNLQSILN
jgi:hypothetical protein